MITIAGIPLTYVLVLGAIGFAVYRFFFASGSSSTSSATAVEHDFGSKRVEDEEQDSSKPKMTVFYGSQTGTAEEFANQFASESKKRYGFNAKVKDLIDLDDPSSQLQEENLVVFFLATYGEGEPTDNARDFYDWLRDEARRDEASEVFGKLSFAVFGLGNKQYKIYQAMGRYFNRRLEELGAKRISEPGEGDADDNIEEQFEDWKNKALPEMSAAFGTTMASGDDKPERKYEMRVFENVKDPDQPFDKPRGIPDAKAPILSTIVAHRRLLSESLDRQTVHIEFDIKGTKVAYEAGDHLAVLAQNPEQLVAAYIARLQLDDATLAKCFSLVKIEDRTASYYPRRTTVRSAFKFLVDLESAPRKQAIRALAEYTQDEAERSRLMLLSSNTNEGKELYNTYVKGACRTMLDLLQDHPGVKVPLDHFLEIMPRLQPRYYSIASSSQLTPNAIHAVVAVVRYKSPLEGRPKEGLCSNYLNRLTVGQQVYIYVRQSSFHLPSDASKPVIMIGPGTGVAPFVGFLQQRKAMLQQGKKLGDGYMFFGCRRKSEDFIYEQEQTEAERIGSLKKLFVAFSRDQGQKVYVQHLVQQNKELIYDVLIKQNGYLYICGDAKHMAKDVDNALHSIFQEYCASKSKEEADKMLAHLTDSKHYLTDVWSSN